MDRCYAKLTLQQLHSVPVLHEGVDPDHRRHEEDPRHADVEAREGDLRRRQEAARVPLRHIHLQSVRGASAHVHSRAPRVETRTGTYGQRVRQLDPGYPVPAVVELQGVQTLRQRADHELELWGDDTRRYNTSNTRSHDAQRGGRRAYAEAVGAVAFVQSQGDLFEVLQLEAEDGSQHHNWASPQGADARRRSASYLHMRIVRHQRGFRLLVVQPVLRLGRRWFGCCGSSSYRKQVDTLIQRNAASDDDITPAAP